MSAPLAIEVRDLQKGFSIPVERQTTLKERALRPTSWRSRSRTLAALRGISFDVHRGEFFGVIGRNGCGKSTLLKLLASIYRRDGGSIKVAGRLAPFIELGVGFNPELSARENVVLNGVMMGLTPAQARSRFDAVIDYAELHEYTDLKLKNYSSGMHVRLAFSLMLQVDADVLLIDEVLAVGDAAFQAKCTESLAELKAQGTTVVLVTHDMDAIEANCDRAMLIEDGLVEMISEPGPVASRYLEVVFADEGYERPVESRPDRGAEVTGAWLTDRAGRTVEEVSRGEPLTFNISIRAREEISGLRLDLILINNPEGVRVANFKVGFAGEIAPLAAGEELTVRVALEDGSLGPGGYRFNYLVSNPERDFALSAEPVRLRVLGDDPEAGVVAMDHRVEIERGGGAGS